MLPAVLAAALLPGAAWAGLPPITFKAERVQAEGVLATDVSFALDGQGRFQAFAGSLRLAAVGRTLDDAALEGMLREASFSEGSVELAGNLKAGAFGSGFEFERKGDGLKLRLEVRGQNLLALQSLPMMPEEVSWLHGGSADLDLSLAQSGEAPLNLGFSLRLQDLAFDSPDGDFAGDGLSMAVEGSLLPGPGLATKLSGRLEAGEALVFDFYRNFSDGGLRFSVQPSWQDGRLELGSIHVSDGDAVDVEGRAGQGPSPDAPWSFEVSHLELNFPGAYHRYLESYLAAMTLDGLEVTGRVNWDGQWSGGQFSSGDLLLEDLSVVDTRRDRFAVTGLDGRLRPGDHAFHSRFSWRGLLLGRINLGPGRVDLDSEPGVVALKQPLELAVLGGHLDLEEFRLRLPGAGKATASDPEIRLRADLKDLDMERLTAALGWPEFHGKISGSIPAVRLNEGVLEVDGKIFVNVFDGLVSLQDLRVERLFGVLPSLAANVEVSNLDLGQLTSTFSFGNISGRLDGYVNDLRMLDWQPVAFDAWLGTPASQTGKQDISRKAVTHLTTLGGGSATAALASPLMRMFSSFSYKRLGMGCVLADNVCEVRGLGEDETSVLIMEGAGVPKITIRAFNRRVDWPQMVANLKAVSAEGEIRVGD